MGRRTRGSKFIVMLCLVKLVYIRLNSEKVKKCNNIVI